MTSAAICDRISVMALLGTLINRYKETYYIPTQELDDFAETNRIHLLVITPVIFLFGILDFFAIILLHHSELENYIASLVYFGIFSLASLFSYIYSRRKKQETRNKKQETRIKNQESRIKNLCR